MWLKIIANLLYSTIYHGYPGIYQDTHENSP
ncbi:hypothetical protein C8D94_101659 [Marinirhabdus gelatinilytica]|uniref:Uncharacterized protein n=1 Tax=Marinirhabdus gelatinilytica TaxID=1703343 RepID=A0A370QKB1_9FLAO|nr:hypothetical protein C8D94_101659 [Marinirhabdus gelatinilytica]